MLRRLIFEAPKEMTPLSFGRVLPFGSCVPSSQHPTFSLTFVLQFAEISNLIVHIKLRNLRPAGTRKRAIPHGYGFSLVSFPNYFFESMAWLVIAVMTGSYTGEWPRYLGGVDTEYGFQRGCSSWFPLVKCTSGQRRSIVHIKRNLELRILKRGRPCFPLLHNTLLGVNVNLANPLSYMYSLHCG